MNITASEAQIEAGARALAERRGKPLHHWVSQDAIREEAALVLTAAAEAQQAETSEDLRKRARKAERALTDRFYEDLSPEQVYQEGYIAGAQAETPSAEPAGSGENGAPSSAESRGSEHSAEPVAKRLTHTYMGDCPDDVNGWESRDPECRACRTLDAEPVAYALYDRNDGELVSVQRWPTGTEHIAFDVRPLYAHPETPERSALAKAWDEGAEMGHRLYAEPWLHIAHRNPYREPVENTEEESA